MAGRRARRRPLRRVGGRPKYAAALRARARALHIAYWPWPCRPRPPSAPFHASACMIDGRDNAHNMCNASPHLWADLRPYIQESHGLAALYIVGTRADKRNHVANSLCTQVWSSR